MKNKTFIFLVCAIFLLSCDKEANDYRDKYYGNYNLTIYSFHWSFGDTILSDNYDTTNIIVKIDKFEGYTSLDGSNYSDIKHKIGIQFRDDFNFDSHTSSCNDIRYYTYGYIHPTINESGKLTYPEFTCDFHNRFEGDIHNGSIVINFADNSIGLGWTKKMIGTKIN